MGWGACPRGARGLPYPFPGHRGGGEACQRAGHGGAVTAPEQVTEGTGAGGEGGVGWVGLSPRARFSLFFISLLFLFSVTARNN